MDCMTPSIQHGFSASLAALCRAIGDAIECGSDFVVFMPVRGARSSRAWQSHSGVRNAKARRRKTRQHQSERRRRLVTSRIGASSQGRARGAAITVTSAVAAVARRRNNTPSPHCNKRRETPPERDSKDEPRITAESGRGTSWPWGRHDRRGPSLETSAERRGNGARRGRIPVRRGFRSRAGRCASVRPSRR